MKSPSTSEMIGNLTDPWENTWQRQVHVVVLVSSCTVLLVTFFAGIAANLFVACAVCRQKSLRNSSNALLVNLAAVDLLRCAVDCPLLLVVVLNDGSSRDLGDLLCDGQVMSFSLGCCVQLFTLASISADRHQAVANPFKSAERRKRVKVWIPLTWAAAAAVSSLCIMYTKDSSVYARCRALRRGAVKAHGSFGLYVLLPVWSVCLALIVGFYSHIFILVKAHNRKIFDKGVSAPTFTATPEDKNKKETKVVIATESAARKDRHGAQFTPSETKERARGAGSSTGDPEDPKTLSTAAESQPLSTDARTSGVKPGKHFKPPGRVTLASELRHDASHLTELESSCKDRGDFSEDAEVPSAATHEQPATEMQNAETEPADPRNNEEDPKEDQNPNSEQLPPGEEKVPGASAGRTLEVMGEVCMMPSFASKERGSKRKESKLAKRSGYIVLTYLVFWMPLIGTVVLTAFMNRDQILEELEVLVVSVSCMTSLTNPIIYAAVNSQFRAEFRSLRAGCNALRTQPRAT